LDPSAAQFDLVIVGGGTAGCVAANRLSASPRTRVLLLEAGPNVAPDRGSEDVLDLYPRSHANMAYRWPGCVGRWTSDAGPLAPLHQARILGGGSSVMGMIAIRGLPQDYDAWASGGASGWGWSDVLPYFRRLETDHDHQGPLHGADGPTQIRRNSVEDWPPLARAALRFARARGLAWVEDLNADPRDGYGPAPLFAAAQRRSGAAIDYLDPVVRSRRNLSILTGAEVTGLAFDGRRVVGVTYRGPEGSRSVLAREVVLAAGALLTPELLLRSGVGPPEALRRVGVPVRADVAGVGQNLQNHAMLSLAAHLRRRGRAIRPAGNPATGFFRLSTGDGPGQIGMVVGARSTWHGIAERVATFTLVLLAPRSRGEVRLERGEDSALRRAVTFNLLGDERDVAALTAGFRLMAEVAQSPEVRPLTGPPAPVTRLDRVGRFHATSRLNRLRTPLIGAAMDLPLVGDGAVGLLGDRELLRGGLADAARVRAHVAAALSGAGHHAGACRMGAAGDPGAVVDPEGRVRGVGGLRVIDASVMPIIPRAPTNLSVLMVAEKLSDVIAAAA